MKSVAIPMLGAGIIGQLEADQSARAMLGRIAAFEHNAKPGQTLPDVSIVVFRDSQAATQAAYALKGRRPLSDFSLEEGRRNFDPLRWTSEMQADWVDSPVNPANRNKGYRDN